MRSATLEEVHELNSFYSSNPVGTYKVAEKVMYTFAYRGEDGERAYLKAHQTEDTDVWITHDKKEFVYSSLFLKAVKTVTTQVRRKKHSRPTKNLVTFSAEEFVKSAKPGDCFYAANLGGNKLVFISARPVQGGYIIESIKYSGGAAYVTETAVDIYTKILKIEKPVVLSAVAATSEWNIRNLVHSTVDIDLRDIVRVSSVEQDGTFSILLRDGRLVKVAASAKTVRTQKVAENTTDVAPKPLDEEVDYMVNAEVNHDDLTRNFLFYKDRNLSLRPMPNNQYRFVLRGLYVKVSPFLARRHQDMVAARERKAK